MATNTTNYNLTKPDEDDFYDISVQNANMDKIDTAIAALGSGDGSASTVTFTQASSRGTLTSGDTTAALWGKAKKWFADLQTIAFTGSYSDLTNVPTSFAPSDHTHDSSYYTKSNVDTMLGALEIESPIAETTAETTMADGDTLPFTDVSASSATKKITLANLKTVLSTWGNTLWSGVGHSHTASAVGADATGTAASAVSTHNTTSSVHSGIVASQMASATALTTVADGDTLVLTDVSASNTIKKITWTNIKAVLKTYFDTLYNLVTVTDSLTSTSTTAALSANQGRVLDGAKADKVASGTTGNLVVLGSDGGIADGGVTIDGLTPVGAMILRTSALDDERYLPCDGSFILSEDYPLLSPLLPDNFVNVASIADKAVHFARAGDSGFPIVAVIDCATIFYSFDGANFYPATISGGSASYTLNAVTYGNNRFVAVGNDWKAATSLDGMTWEITDVYTGSFIDDLIGVVFGDGLFFAVDSSFVFQSTDGYTWARTQPGSSGSSRYNGTIVYGNSVLALLGYGDQNVYYTTAAKDYSTWYHSGGDLNDSTRVFLSSAYGNGIYATIATTGRVYTSNDGADWTYTGTEMTGGIYFYNGLFWCGETDLYTSEDCVAWTKAIDFTEFSGQTGTIVDISCYEDLMLVSFSDGALWSFGIAKKLPNLDFSPEPTYGYIRALGVI